MNLLFLLAGAPNPSAFSTVIPVVLLLANIEAVLRLDGRRAPRVRSLLPTSQPVCVRAGSPGRRSTALVVMAAMIVTAYARLHVTDWNPGSSAEDRAMVLAILGGLGAIGSGIASLRTERFGPRTEG